MNFMKRLLKISFRPLVALIFTICALFGIAAAEAPFEQFYVARADINDSVRINMIGILTVNQHAGVGRVKIPKFRCSDKGFEGYGDIDLHIATRPVSSWGYALRLSLGAEQFKNIIGGKEDIIGDRISQNGDRYTIDLGLLTDEQRVKLGEELYSKLILMAQQQEKYLSNYRFPVTAIDGEFMEIVINPVSYVTVWIRKKDLGKSFGSLIMLNDLTGAKCIDAFSLTNNDKRKVYGAPGDSTHFKVMAKEQFGWCCEVMEQSGDYIRLGQVEIGNEGLTGELEPIGWIKIHDRRKHCTIWIKSSYND